MAQRMHIILEDDVDGSSADTTVTFAVEGVSYEIDLSQANVEKFRSDLAPWIGHARRTGGRSSRPAGRTKSADGTGRAKSTSDSTAIRTWARENGYEVSDRGRVSAEIRAAYERAN